jgi:hypothetical protein
LSFMLDDKVSLPSRFVHMYMIVIFELNILLLSWKERKEDEKWGASSEPDLPPER